MNLPFFVFFSLWAFTIVNAVPMQGQNLTVDEIAQRYEDALGGRVGLDKVNTRVWKGTSENKRLGLLPGKLEVRADASGKWVVTQWAWGGKRVSEQTFDGTVGFFCGQGKGEPVPTNSDSVAENSVMFGFSGRHLIDRISQQKLVGKETLGKLEAYVIEGNYPDGASVRAYFDTKSGLLVRFDFGRGSASRNSAVFFEDFREVDGVKVPFVIQLYKLESVFLMKFERIEQNVRLDAKAFQKPRSC